MHATPDVRKPWIAEAQAAGRSVPAWIAERAATRDEFEQLMVLRERAFPATRPTTLTLAQAAQLTQLDEHEILWAVEQYNVCSTDAYNIFPSDDDGRFVVRQR